MVILDSGLRIRSFGPPAPPAARSTMSVVRGEATTGITAPCGRHRRPSRPAMIGQRDGVGRRVPRSCCGPQNPPQNPPPHPRRRRRCIHVEHASPPGTRGNYASSTIYRRFRRAALVQTLPRQPRERIGTRIARDVWPPRCGAAHLGEATTRRTHVGGEDIGTKENGTGKRGAWARGSARGTASSASTSRTARGLSSTIPGFPLFVLRRLEKGENRHNNQPQGRRHQGRYEASNERKGRPRGERYNI